METTLDAANNIAAWIDRQAALAPGRVAVETAGSEVSYRALADRGASCGGALSSLGVGPGDRVAALLGNRAEYIELFLACARLGAILVPLSTHLTSAELGFMTTDAGARLLVYESAYAETVKSFAPATEIQRALVLDEGDDLSYEAAITAAEPVGIAEVGGDDVLAIFYTSGTTGTPKGAMLTHANFFWTNLNMVVALDIARDERSLVVLPMFHVGGWNVNTLSVWLKGGRVVLEPSFEPGRVLSLIQDQRVTGVMGVPTIYQRLAEHEAFDDTDFSGIRWSVCGGAPLPIGLIRRYLDRGVPFTQGYGLTEAAPNCLFLPPEDSEAKAGAAGRPYFFIDVEVFDAHDERVGPGGQGEIVARGPSIMKGYWRRPEETAETLRDGWLRTGDVGRVDDDGCIYVVDRVKDMYISGGENVYPAEVEKALVEHPSVIEAAVIGIPDEKWGEAGRALVVVGQNETVGAAELEAFLGQRLAGFKIPRSFVLVNELPRNSTGKLLKGQLRAEFGGSQ